ncbi:MAG: hypothetical protein LBH14_06530 [Desulfobulbaceae bacterium]|nr:hypothetical protein [Desulfobulbaceae bacterium]
MPKTTRTTSRISRRQALSYGLTAMAGSLLPVGLAGCLGTAAQSTGKAALDTSHWKTHCVGRFLVRLPADAKTRYSAKILGYDIVWRPDLTPEKARREAERAAAKYKTIPHREIPGASQFIAMFPLPGGGIVLHRWDVPYSKLISIMECYFASQDARGHVFFHSPEVPDDSFDIAM